MTKNEILFFGFIFLFFLIISLVKSNIERAFFRWSLRLAIWRKNTVIFILLISLAYIIEPDLTRKFISIFIKMIIFVFTVIMAAMESVAVQAGI